MNEQQHKPRRQSAPANWRERETITVEHYQRIMGVSRDTAYGAVKAGDVATIRAGRCIRVCVPPLRRQLDGEQR